MTDSSEAAPRPEQSAVVGDGVLARALWPLLTAGFVTQLPIVASNLFVVSIAVDTDSSVALIGGLRGLSGLTALATGVLAAPLIDRVPRAWSVTGGLVLLGAATALASLGQLPTLIAFYLLIGSTSAVLLPSIQAAGADQRPGAAGVRAATLLTGVPSLAAVLAGPVLAVPAEWWGWRGDFLAMTVVAALLALVTSRRLSHAPPPDVARPGYLVAFRAVAAADGAVPLLLGSTLRSTLFFGWLTYLTAYCAERFELSIFALGLLFSLGGTGFFLSNLVGGRLASLGDDRARRPIITLERLAVSGLVVAGLAGPSLYLTPLLPLVVLLTGLHTAGHGACLAGVVGLLIRRYPELRGAVMGLNVAGTNLGTFAGAALGAGGLAVGGYVGLAAMLAALALLALVLTAAAIRR